MSRVVLHGGEQAPVKCPCGWHGYRSRSTTQPCPSCCKPIDWLAVKQQRRGYNKRHEAAKAEREKAQGERIRQAHVERLEREAAERDAIAAMLRASVDDLRPLRRTP